MAISILKNKAQVWGIYFLIVLACALPHGIRTKVDVIGLTNTQATELSQTATVSRVISVYDMGDAGTYARMATNLAHGKFTEYEYWRLRLFAPGDTFIEAICLRLFGARFPIVLFFTLLTSVFWASVLFNLRALGDYKNRPYLNFFLPLVVLCNGLMILYFLRKGIMLSESLSTAGLALSFLYLVRSSSAHRLKFAIWSGVFLAFAAYMRAQNELVGLALNLLFVLSSVVAIIYFVYSRKLRHRFSNPTFAFSRAFPPLLSLLIALTAFNALTIPYRLWNLRQYNSTSWLQWDHYWEANWRDENLMRTRDNDQRLIDQGETVAAHVNPELAAKIRKEVSAKGPFAFSDDFYKKSSIITFIRHPRIWITLKYPAAVDAWLEFKRGPYVTDWTGDLHLEHVVFFLILLFCAIRFLFVAPFVKKFSGSEFIYFAFYATLFGANIATTIFIHLEHRYYYTLKMMSLIMCVGTTMPILTRLKNARDPAEVTLSKGLH